MRRLQPQGHRVIGHDDACDCDTCWLDRRRKVLAYRQQPDRWRERGSYGPRYTGQAERQAGYRQRKENNT